MPNKSSQTLFQPRKIVTASHEDIFNQSLEDLQQRLCILKNISSATRWQHTEITGNGGTRRMHWRVMIMCKSSMHMMAIREPSAKATGYDNVHLYTLRSKWLSIWYLCLRKVGGICPYITAMLWLNVGCGSIESTLVLRFGSKRRPQAIYCWHIFHRYQRKYDSPGHSGNNSNVAPMLWSNRTSLDWKKQQNNLSVLDFIKRDMHDCSICMGRWSCVFNA